MKIALFGKTGQVATELQRRVPVGTEIEVFGRNRVDFADPDAVRKAVESVDADAIINAVAYTAVDTAESEVDTARLVNATSVAALANASGVPIVHISTDYVFDGTGNQPRPPGAPTAPLGVYGATKLDGEEAIRASGTPHVILRTSWVFSAHGANFVKTMLRLTETRDALSIVSDQIGGPTPAAAIADACFAATRALADGHPGGTFHFAGKPDVSWSDFAREIFAQAGRDVTVTDIPTADYPTPARRPLNSRLDCSATEAAFGIPRPDWRDGLATVLNELGAAPWNCPIGPE